MPDNQLITSQEIIARNLKTLREYLGKDRIVSVAVGASRRCIADTQMDKVAEMDPLQHLWNFYFITKQPIISPSTTSQAGVCPY